MRSLLILAVAAFSGTLLLLGEVTDSTFYNNVRGFLEKQREDQLQPPTETMNPDLTYAFKGKLESTHKKAKDIDFHLGSGLFFDIDLDKKKVTIDKEEEQKKKRLKKKLKKILKDYDDDDDDDCDDDGHKFFSFFGRNTTEHNSNVSIMGIPSTTDVDSDNEDDYEANKGIRVGSGFYFDVTLDKDKKEVGTEEFPMQNAPLQPRPPQPGYYDQYRPPPAKHPADDSDCESDDDEENEKYGSHSFRNHRKLWFWPFSVNQVPTNALQAQSVDRKAHISSNYLLSHAMDATSNLFTIPIPINITQPKELIKKTGRRAVTNSTKVNETAPRANISFTSDTNRSSGIDSKEVNWWEFPIEEEYSSTGPITRVMNHWIVISSIYAIIITFV